MSELPRGAAVVIVGGGVMGASTAHHLARRGARDVLLLEREAFFGAGATGRCAGGIRHQFGSEVNVRLSLASLPRLDAFEEETGQPALVRKCGYLFVLTREADARAFRRQLELQRRLGVRVEWLDGDAVRRALPQFHFPDAVGGTFGPDDGLADPASVVAGYVAGARRAGARLLTDVEVTGVSVRGGRVRGVETSRGAVETSVVVNAAGPWAAPLGALAGVEVPVVPLRRQWLTTTALPEIPAELPFVIDFARGLYFHREGPGLLTGMSNPDEKPGFAQSVDRDWELVHLAAAAERLPLVEGAGIASRTAGLYEVTPDAHPLLGATPVAGFYLLAGFSGHGFMHGPACGQLMAELILDGRIHSLDVAALDPARFAAGRSLNEYNVV